MSEFKSQINNPKSNWAQDDDSDSEDEFVKVTKEEELISDDESDDSDDDSDDDYGKMNNASTGELKKEVKKEVVNISISKAERKALKQKELCDLDNLLAEFGIDKSATENINNENVVNAAETEELAEVIKPSDDGGESKKKKKKSKDKKKEKAVESTPCSSEQPLVVDVASLLKSKISTKAKKVDNQAVSEALKEAAKKKKKADKKNYSEYSY